MIYSLRELITKILAHRIFLLVRQGAQNPRNTATATAVTDGMLMSFKEADRLRSFMIHLPAVCEYSYTYVIMLSMLEISLSHLLFPILFAWLRNRAFPFNSNVKTCLT
jgi:hypothetical protein